VGNGRRSAIAAVVFALATVPMAFGTSANCPTGTGTTMTAINALANGLTTGGTTVSTTGCGATDQTFGNFFESGFTATGGSTTFTTGTDGFVTSNAVANLFTVGGGVSDAAGTFDNNRTDTGNFAFLTQFGTASGVKPVANNGVDTVELTLTGVSIPDDAEVAGNAQPEASIKVTILACVGTTTAPAATFTTCPNGTAETITDTITNTSTTAALTGTLNFFLGIPAGSSVVSVDDTIVLNSNFNGAASFTGFDQDFESPEPSTFILLGSALVLIGLLHLRARRKSAAAAIQ
jgi:hypothetical protein